MLANMHAAASQTLAGMTYRNVITPTNYTNANIQVGGVSGGVVDNQNYQFNGRLVRVGQQVYLYSRIGQDYDYVEPAGAITRAVFDIPSRSWVEGPVVVFDQGAEWMVYSQFWQVRDGRLWCYFSRTQRDAWEDLAAAEFMLMRSTDGLVGKTFETPILLGRFGHADICGIIDGAPDGSIKYMVLGGSAPRIKFLRMSPDGLSVSTDNVPTVSYGARLMTEGQFINVDRSGRVIGVMRDNNGSELLYTVSSDWGATWTPIASTGLGASTGAKVTPKLLKAAGRPNNLFAYFNDRGAGLLCFVSGHNPVDSAFSGAWNNEWQLGDLWSQGNGDSIVIDEARHEYLIFTAKHTADTPTQTDTRFWVLRDGYEKTLYPNPWQ